MHGAINSEGNNLWILEGIDHVVLRAVAKLGVSESFDNYEFSNFFSSLIFAKGGG